MSILQEIPLTPLHGTLPQPAADFAETGLRRSKSIDCFDFVPCDYHTVHAVLSGLPAGRFCEWGSGMGIVTGIAAMLGFEAVGIEIDEKLAQASRELLRDFNISARIITGSYYEVLEAADYYFAYCWPSQMQALEQHFLSAMPVEARLLICHGAEDIRCKQKSLS